MYINGPLGLQKDFTMRSPPRPAARWQTPLVLRLGGWGVISLPTEGHRSFEGIALMRHGWEARTDLRRAGGTYDDKARS